MVYSLIASAGMSLVGHNQELQSGRFSKPFYVIDVRAWCA